jgi:hypothetical protein
LTYPRISNYFARRAGLRQAQAWYQTARSFTLSPGTLIYSEHPADLAAVQQASTTWGSNASGTCVIFDAPHPALRRMGYSASGVPTIFRFNIIYAHEHLYWDTSAPSGTSPHVVTVMYAGPDQQGRPRFDVITYGRPDTVRWPFRGGSSTVATAPARPLTNLRIFAGQPHPTDRARFSLPFTCDAGTGSFDFRMDTDVSDGGLVAPAVTITWNDLAATRPAK